MAKAVWVIPQLEWVIQCGTQAVGTGGRAGTASRSLLQLGPQPSVLEKGYLPHHPGLCTALPDWIPLHEQEWLLNRKTKPNSGEMVMYTGGSCQALEGPALGDL